MQQPNARYPRTPYGQLSAVITRSAKCSDERHDLIVAIIERTALDAAGYVSAPIPSGQTRDGMRVEADEALRGAWLAKLCDVVGLDPKRVARWAAQTNSVRKMQENGGMRTHESTRAWGKRLVADGDPFGEALVEIADAWAVDRESRAAEVTKRVLNELSSEMMDASDDREHYSQSMGLAQAAQAIKDYAARI